MEIDDKFFSYRKQYFIQSGYAAVSIFIITFILYNNPVVIASIGATAFIVFFNAKQYYRTAQKNNWRTFGGVFCRILFWSLSVYECVVFCMFDLCCSSSSSSSSSTPASYYSMSSSSSYVL